MCYFSEAIYNNECVPLLSSICTIVDACIIPKKLCSPFKVDFLDIYTISATNYADQTFNLYGHGKNGLTC